MTSPRTSATSRCAPPVASSLRTPSPSSSWSPRAASAARRPSTAASTPASEPSALARNASPRYRSASDCAASPSALFGEPAERRALRQHGHDGIERTVRPPFHVHETLGHDEVVVRVGAGAEARHRARCAPCRRRRGLYCDRRPRRRRRECVRRRPRGRRRRRGPRLRRRRRRRPGRAPRRGRRRRRLDRAPRRRRSRSRRGWYNRAPHIGAGVGARAQRPTLVRAARPLRRGDRRLGFQNGRRTSVALAPASPEPRRVRAREERAILEATEDVGRVADAAEVNVRECQRRVALRRLVEGPEFLDTIATGRRRGLESVDEIRLHEGLFRAQKTFDRFLLLERPGDELIEVPHVVEEARLGERYARSPCSGGSSDARRRPPTSARGGRPRVAAMGPGPRAPTPSPRTLVVGRHDQDLDVGTRGGGRARAAPGGGASAELVRGRASDRRRVDSSSDGGGRRPTVAAPAAAAAAR